LERTGKWEVSLLKRIRNMYVVGAAKQPFIQMSLLCSSGFFSPLICVIALYVVVVCFFVFLTSDWVNNYPFLFSLSFDYEDAGYETSSLIRVSTWIWHRWTSVCLLFCCTGHTVSMILYVPTCLYSLLHSTMYLSRACHIPCFIPISHTHQPRVFTPSLDTLHWQCMSYSLHRTLFTYTSASCSPCKVCHFCPLLYEPTSIFILII